MSRSSTPAKNTAATCRTEAAVTPPPAASAAARTGTRTVPREEMSPMVFCPRPMRALRSPADTAVIQSAPAAPAQRPTASRPSGAALSSTPRSTTPAMIAAVLRTPERRWSFSAVRLSCQSFPRPRRRPKLSSVSPERSSAASGEARSSSGGSSAAQALPHSRQAASRAAQI